MAFCRKCGTHLDDYAKFCPSCGATQELTNVPAPTVYNPIQESESGPWKAFAIIGFVLGLVGFILAFFAGVGFVFAIPGLVFSILGKRSSSKHGMATTGMVFSIIGLSLGLVIYVSCIIYAAGIGSYDYYGYYDYYANLLKNIF